MRSSLLVFTLLLIVYSESLSQNGWFVLATNTNISTIKMADSLNGWAGMGGGLFKTIDGGKNWLKQELAVGSVNEIIFIDQNFGLAACNNGIILKTTNSGFSWRSITTATNENLTDICFINNMYGWACSQQGIVYTRDQGESWEYVSVPAISHRDIAFRNIHDGWLIGLYGGCFRSSNGGVTWQSVNPPISGRSLFGICFTSELNGYMIGGEQIAMTTDGGNFWKIVYQLGSSQLNSISFSDTLNGWAAGSDKILRTTDGGKNWKQQIPGIPFGYINYVYAYNRDIGFISSENTLLKTVTGGIISDVKDDEELKSKGFELFQNYPNPFNPSTIIKFSIPKQQHVRITVTNVLAENLVTLMNEIKPEGVYEIDFKANNLNSGIYFYTLKTKTYSVTKKMILSK